MKKILLILLCALPFSAYAQTKESVPNCGAPKTPYWLVVMSDGDIVRVKPDNVMEYSRDKGVTWKVVGDGTWPTMDGRQLTGKGGKFVTLQ